jgi:ApaG protein
MVTETTQGISVTVEAVYQPEFSNPMQAHFVFEYTITIKNDSPYTIQLLRRQWTIFDCTGVIRVVEGEGVVGEQPVIEPGQSHVYSSGCNLKSSIGKMVGTYQMQRTADRKPLTVRIPEFSMIVPYRNN